MIHEIPVAGCQTLVLVEAGDSPRMPQVDYGQCEHRKLYKDGFDPTVKRGKVQRFKCATCGKPFVEGSRSLFEMRAAIGRDLMRGLSMRAVSRRRHVTYKAVRRVLDLIADKRTAPCACGKPASHSGGCRQLEPAKAAAIQRDLCAGLSLNAVQQRNGVGQSTVYSVLAGLPEGARPSRCPCGKPIGHGGRRLRNCAGLVYTSDIC